MSDFPDGHDTVPVRPGWQFSLRWLMGLITILGACFALVHWAGVGWVYMAVFCASCAVVASVMLARSRLSLLRRSLLAIVLFVLTVIVVYLVSWLEWRA